MRRVLVLAYYFPPMGLSGVQRTAKFVKYLPESGWQPTVVTCTPRGYFAYDATLLEEIEAAGVDVHRTASWDPTRLFGRETVVDLPPESARRTFSLLSQLLFVPDNKIGWWIPARRQALTLHRQAPFDLIYASAPPYTAHLVGAGLSRRTGAPLVLDFRDDWVGNPRHTYPTPLHRGLSSYLERKALAVGARTVVINDVIRQNVLSRNRDVAAPDDVIVIPQGFDHADLDVQPSIPGVHADPSVFTLVYSGVFYDAQTPEPFLRAVAGAVRRRSDLRERIRAVFVGLLPDSAKALAASLGIQDLVHHTGYLPHREAVGCLLTADVLWMTVGHAEGAESISTSKLFEYFGTKKPVLGLVPDGAARDALQQYAAAEIADPEDVPAIRARIETLYTLWLADRLPEPASGYVDQFDRAQLTRRLARVFDDVLQENAPYPREAGPTRA